MVYEFYIVFLKNKNPLNILARLIRLAENTEYNHVEIMVTARGEFITGRTMSWGAVHPKSRKIEYKKLFEKYDLVKTEHVKINIDQSDAVKILNSLTGRKYSFLQLIVLLFKVAFNALASPMSKVKLNLDKYLICTELVAIFLEKCAGVKFDSVEALTLKDLDKKWAE